MRRLLPLVTTLATAALIATGCATTTGPPAARGDVAAVVGERTIPVATVQQELRTSVPDLRAALARRAETQGTSGELTPEVLAAQSRGLLTRAVLHELIAEQGRREGIVVTDADVDARLTAAGGAEALAAETGFDVPTLRELIADQLTSAEIGRRAFDRLQITVDYASVPDRAAADALARRVAADPGGGALATLGPGRSAAGLVLRPGTDQGAGVRAVATSVLFGLPAGTVSVISGSPAAGAASSAPDPSTQPWIVVRTLQRTLDAPPPGPGTVRAAQVDDQTMVDFGLRTLQPLAGELGIAVNPRFGTWDPTQLEVVAPPSAAGAILAAATPTPPAPAATPAPPAPAAAPAPSTRPAPVARPAP